MENDVSAHVYSFMALSLFAWLCIVIVVGSPNGHLYYGYRAYRDAGASSIRKQTCRWKLANCSDTMAPSCPTKHQTKVPITHTAQSRDGDTTHGWISTPYTCRLWGSSCLALQATTVFMVLQDTACWSTLGPVSPGCFRSINDQSSKKPLGRSFILRVLCIRAPADI